MKKKNGTPISEVIIPIGKIIPGITTFDNIDAIDRIKPPIIPDTGIKYL